LWIPLSFAGVPEGMWARDYPGKLFRVERSARLPPLPAKTAKAIGPVRALSAQFSTADKAPLLFSATDRKPKYFGKPYVNIPQKFHLRSIAKEEVKRLPLLFRVEMQKSA
jgi:hypothetical protein